MSLDQIGPLANSVEDVKLVFDVIVGKDENDATSLSFSEKETLGKEKLKLSKIKIGIPKVSADPEILKLINSKVDEVIKSNGWQTTDIEIKHIDLGIQTYYPIVYVEFASGTRKFDGRRYGLKIEDSCGEEVLRRILGGQEITQEEYGGRYYKKALDAKAIIKQEFMNAFEKVDCIVMPVVPNLPRDLGGKTTIEQEYAADALSVLANLAEIPAISVPAGEIEGIPVGVQILCKVGDDKKLLAISKGFE